MEENIGLNIQEQPATKEDITIVFNPENTYSSYKIIIYKDGNIYKEITKINIQPSRFTLSETGIYNIETCVANGKPYIMEVSPRGGGCKIAELQTMAYGIDLIEAEVRKAVGLPLNEIKQTACNGYWCETIVHARPGQSGVLKAVTVDPEIAEKHLMVTDLSAKPGDYIQPFTGANMSLGDMFFRFNSREELNEVMGRQKEWLKIELE